MPRLPRNQIRSRLVHIFNRGTAKRPVFLGAEQMRFFMFLLRKQVEERRWRLHAFSLMGTHFHLHAEGEIEAISAAMQWVTARYTQEFNRRHDRDGALFRGRFASKEICSDVHRWHVQRYIDMNPVAAGIVSDPCAYEYGSARLLATAAPQRIVDPTWTHTLMDACREPGDSWRETYVRAFGLDRYPAGQDAWAERFLQRKRPCGLSAHVFVHQAPGAVRAWLLERTRLADGRAESCPVSAEAVLEFFAPPKPAWLDPGHAASLLPALLRDLSGLTRAEIGRCTGLPPGKISHLLAVHRSAMLGDEAYQEVAARTTLCAGAKFARAFPGF